MSEEAPLPSSSQQQLPPTPPQPCTAGGKRPQESNFEHCPIPQSFVRCGPHHRAHIRALDESDVNKLYQVWKTYRDDLTWPWYDKKPLFSDRDYKTFRDIAQKVVDAMVAEYKEPMVLDQATISNTNHIGHPPHADNVQFDSVWWKGQRIRQEDEVVAAQEGAYVLWRPEKTSYRSYSCTTALTDPDSYEGGEVQFFDKWGDKDPTTSYRCKAGEGIAFCGCQRNIHAVTGVRRGFRLVLLVWTRPPNVRVPESQTHVCYFRPGTGRGVWLTTADQQRCKAPKRDREWMQPWAVKDEDDEGCSCPKCEAERLKVSWSDCLEPEGSAAEAARPRKAAGVPSPSTPPTSAGTSPRTNDSQVSDADEASTAVARGSPAPPQAAEGVQHCPKPQCSVPCSSTRRIELNEVLSKADVSRLHEIWQKHQDDLTWPWYDKKPEFSDAEFYAFRDIVQKVVDAIAAAYGQPCVLDQATISSANHIGHPPHADNVQFDSVWWRGKQIKQRDELAASRGGAEVLWREAKTAYRNYSGFVALTEPWEYTGGELEFYAGWGDKDPSCKYQFPCGSGIAYSGCQKNIHALTGVKWGWRLVLLVWTRPPDAVVPEDQKHLCYFRPGSGCSVWLTTADLEQYPRRRKRPKWAPVGDEGKKEEWNDASIQ